MTRTTKKAAAKLNTAIAGAVKRFAPPESLAFAAGYFLLTRWLMEHKLDLE